MGKKTDQPLHDAIHEGNQLIKNIEKQLGRLDKLRKKTSLENQACTKVIKNTSMSDETFTDAQKQLQGMDLNPVDMSTGNTRKKNKKRHNRLGRAVHRKLQI